MRSHDLERVAETHFMLRWTLERSLKTSFLSSEEITRQGGDVRTMYDTWVRSRSNWYFDMGTFIRAGAAVETALRNAYMTAMGHANVGSLRSDPAYKRGIFQRILPWQPDQGVALLASVGHDLSMSPDLREVQELMLHRHLYAHAAGVIDDDYIDRLKQLTGEDLRANPRIMASYPQEDVVWFEPLGRLNTFIEAARRFLRPLP